MAIYKNEIPILEFATEQHAVQIMEKLIAGGVQEIIAAGCCGTLVEDTEG